MLFGTRIDTRRPLWLKIERIAAAREAAKLAAGKADKDARRVAMHEAKRKHRARVTRRELVEQRIMAKLRDSSRPEKILWEVAIKHGVARDVLTRKLRSHFSGRQARLEACWRLYSETSMSTKVISQRLGGIDHTTVLHAVGCWMRRFGAELPPHRARNGT